MIASELGPGAGFAPLGLEVFGSFGLIAFAVIMLVVHVGFALGVLRDAQSRAGGPDLVGPVIWALATLLGGVFTAVAYWALHHSTFRRREP